jgi:hypothetical protein
LVWLKLCALEKTYSSTMASCERPHNNLRGPSRDPKPCISWAWPAGWEDLFFKLTNWALNDSNSFCRVWTWMAWAWSTSLLSALCSFFLAFLLELPLVGKTWVEGWGALAFGGGPAKMLADFAVVTGVASVPGT